MTDSFVLSTSYGGIPLILTRKNTQSRNKDSYQQKHEGSSHAGLKSQFDSKLDAVRLMLLPCLCPMLVIRGVMLVMGTTLPLEADVVEVVVRPSLISMVRNVFMSGSSSP